MAHWLYILGGLGSGSLGYALWYYGPRAFFLFLAGTAVDDEHRRAWLEAARLTRKDAKDLPSYPRAEPVSGKPVASKRPRSPKLPRGDDDHRPSLDNPAS
jgi:hypothetical protein